MGCTCSIPMEPVLIPREQRNFGVSASSPISRRSNASRTNRVAPRVALEDQGNDEGSGTNYRFSDRNPLVMPMLPTFGQANEPTDDEAENLWVAADRRILLEELENRRSMWQFQQMRDQRLLAVQLEDAASAHRPRSIVSENERPAIPTDAVNSSAETEQVWEGGSNYMDLTLGHRTPAELCMQLAQPQHDDNDSNPGAVLGRE